MVNMSAEQMERLDGLDKLQQQARDASLLAGDYYGRGEYNTPVATLELINSLIGEVKLLASALREQAVGVVE